MWPTITAVPGSCASSRYGTRSSFISSASGGVDHAALVRVTGRVAVAGEVLEHRRDSGFEQPPRVGARVLGDLLRVGAEGAVADHGVVVLVGDVDDGREVDGDAQVLHRLAALEGDVVDVLQASPSGRARAPTACTPMRLFSRETRPPSSSVLTASGSGPADGGDLLERIAQHRQVGPAADHDAADVVAWPRPRGRRRRP